MRASRARVGKATIYRRSSSKEELVVDAVNQLKMPFDDVDSGSARGDLVAIGRQVMPAAVAGHVSRLMPKLMSEAANDPALHAAYHRNLVAPRRRIIAAVLERGVARGEIRADIDLLTDMVVGPFVYRIIISGGDPKFPPTCPSAWSTPSSTASPPRRAAPGGPRPRREPLTPSQPLTGLLPARGW